MNMFDVLKKLAELDSNNTNGVQEARGGFYDPIGDERREWEASDREWDRFKSREQNYGVENEVNNFQIVINGRNWKVFPGEHPADSAGEMRQLQRLQQMCARKSRESGKKWEVYITGMPATTEGMGAQSDSDHGSHGEETISPIHGQTDNPDPAKHEQGKTMENSNEVRSADEEPHHTMENLDTKSLQYLAGVKKTLEECGMMPPPMLAAPPMPASINVTAGSGEELAGMLKDILGLAGIHKDTSGHMPLDTPDAGPSKMVSVPALSQPSGELPDMKKLIGMVDDNVEMEEDSMNPEDQRGWDNSPEEEGKAEGNFPMDGDQDNNFSNELVGKDKHKHHMTTEEGLMAAYREFVAESKKCNCTAKGEECPVHGMKACECYVEESAKPKCCCEKKGKAACPVHGKKKVKESRVDEAEWADDTRNPSYHGDMDESSEDSSLDNKILKVYGDIYDHGDRMLDYLENIPEYAEWLEAGHSEEFLAQMPEEKKEAMLDQMINLLDHADDIDSPDYDDSMDGDHASALASAGWGSDEDYGSASDMYEGKKPSAGMSKKAKSSLVKKAKSGKDIGKKGKGFEKVAKAAGGGEKGKRIAAAAMWKTAAKK